MTNLGNYIENSVSVGIIGSAGRGMDYSIFKSKSRHYYWERMLMITQDIINDESIQNITFVSGGAAWTDHVALELGKNLNIPYHLYLPTNKKDEERRKYLHEGFSLQIKDSPVLTYNETLESLLNYTRVKGGFKDRNKVVASKSDILIAFTFGTQEEQIKMYDSSITAEHAGLKAGGTAHTWNLCNSDKKYHINLNRI